MMEIPPISKLIHPTQTKGLMDPNLEAMDSEMEIGTAQAQAMSMGAAAQTI